MGSWGKLMTGMAAAALTWSAQIAAQQAAAPVANPTAATPYTAEDFAKLPQAEAPALAPDGHAFAAKLAIADAQQFAIVPTGEGGKPFVVRLGDVDLNWWRWVDDEWLILGIGSVEPVVDDDWYITRVVAVSERSHKIVPLTRAAGQNAADVIWQSHDGAPRILLSYQESIYVSEPGFWPKVDEIDLATGRRRTVQRPVDGVGQWFADGDGTVRMGIAHANEGRSTRVLYRDTAGQSYRIIDRARSRDEGVIAPAVFLPDHGKALMVGDDDAGLSALYGLDLTTLKRGDQLFASKGFDIAGPVVDETGYKLLGVAVNERRPAVRWLDPEMAALQADAAKIVKGADVLVTSYSRDRSRAILDVSGADAPGAYFLFDRKTSNPQVIAYTNDKLGMHRLNPVRTIRYKARDGLEVAAVLTLPKAAGAHAANLPLIVLPHGGPFARDAEEWDWWTQFLAQRGYAVVQPNYRGSSGYGTPFAAKGQGQWGLAMQDDLNDAVAALAAQGIADPKRVCVVGASYGGYAAMRAAERDGRLYRCAVAFAGVSDLPGMLRYNGQFFASGASNDWLKKQAPDLAAVSPLSDPAGFSIPILLVHGAKDRVVPVRQSRLLAQKLKKAGKDVTYIEQPLADHHFSRAADRLEFLKAMDAFLHAHNPA